MGAQALVKKLSEAIASAARAANFCVAGTMPNVDPKIVVAKFGPLTFPLDRTAAERLRSVGRRAPYGKGTRTLVNPRVRDTHELDPSQFEITNPAWDDALREAVRTAAKRLGLPPDRVEPQLYKLLVYHPGGFFLPHRDSEKVDRMVASLIVALPTPFRGGTLTVRHGDASQRLQFAEAAEGRAPCFAAFYADCEHEVSRVAEGFRLCLAYNLAVRPAVAGKRGETGRKRATRGKTAPAETLATSITSWVARSPSEPLVFALDHHYTQRGLSLDLLKGTDRSAADLILEAADLAGCRATLCQVSRHIVQHADDGRWDRSWRESAAVPRNLQLGEIYEDEVSGSEWVDAAGKRQDLPEMALLTQSIVSHTPVDRWKPTREEYEGFTGNAGNTLDRWYHRSAICIWHRDRHDDVIADADLRFAIGLLRTSVDRLKSFKKPNTARDDCLRLARAIIAHWRPNEDYGGHSVSEYEKSLADFPKLLGELDDVALVTQFLTGPARIDECVDLANLVVPFCRKHGCASIADELSALGEGRTDELSLRNLIWLDALARARLSDSAGDTLIAKVARSMASQFCKPATNRYGREDSATPREALVPLVRVLTIAGADRELDNVIRSVNSDADRFPLESVQIPSLEKIVGWFRRDEAAVPYVVTGWLDRVQRELLDATAEEPQPPANWARPAAIGCTCQFCKQLNAMLADPAAPTGRIAASEHDRSHLEMVIRRNECDVTHRLDRTGRPYSLVFTKTTGSFERRKKRYAADLKLLATVNGLLPRTDPS